MSDDWLTESFQPETILTGSLTLAPTDRLVAPDTYSYKKKVSNYEPLDYTSY